MDGDGVVITVLPVVMGTCDGSIAIEIKSGNELEKLVLALTITEYSREGLMSVTFKDVSYWCTYMKT